jgi:hypothetical protein
MIIRRTRTCDSMMAFVGTVVAIVSAGRLRDGGKGMFDKGFGPW